MRRLWKSDKDDDDARGSPSPGGGMGLSRDLKRMMAKRERAADRLTRPPVAQRKRTKPREFLKEVRGELGRVSWPTRSEVVTYTMVVIVSVAFFLAVIAGLDYGVGKGVIWLLTRGGK